MYNINLNYIDELYEKKGWNEFKKITSDLKNIIANRIKGYKGNEANYVYEIYDILYDLPIDINITDFDHDRIYLKGYDYHLAEYDWKPFYICSLDLSHEGNNIIVLDVI